MSIIHPIGRFKTGTYTVTRTVAGTPVLGVYAPGSTSTFPIDASIQPMSGREMLVLPVERRGQDVRKLWTKTAELYIVRPGFEADTLVVSGEVFEVFNVKTWPHHWACQIARQVKP